MVFHVSNRVLPCYLRVHFLGSLLGFLLALIHVWVDFWSCSFESNSISLLHTMIMK